MQSFRICFHLSYPTSSFATLPRISTLTSNSSPSFWVHHVVCGTLVPQPGFKLVSLALEVLSLNPETTREVPLLHLLKSKCEYNVLWWCPSTGNLRPHCTSISCACLYYLLIAVIIQSFLSLTGQYDPKKETLYSVSSVPSAIFGIIIT